MVLVQVQEIELALGMGLKCYTSVVKGLKLQVRRFRWLISTFAEVTEEKLEGRDLFAPPFPILNRANNRGIK